MSTVSRDLPSRPHLDVPKREARALLKEVPASDPYYKAAQDSLKQLSPK